MSAHTLVSAVVVGQPLTGVKLVAGTFTGSTSYDTGGSILDLSSVFKDECRGGIVQDATTGVLQAALIPTTSTNAAATTKVMLIDKDGTQESSSDDMHTTTYSFLAWGTDV